VLINKWKNGVFGYGIYYKKDTDGLEMFLKIPCLNTYFRIRPKWLRVKGLSMFEFDYMFKFKKDINEW
jgi:hypothetical protein